MQVEVVKKGWENNSDLSELSIRELLEDALTSCILVTYFF